RERRARAAAKALLPNPERGQRDVGRIVLAGDAALALQLGGIRGRDLRPAALVARGREVMLVDRDAPQSPDAVLEHGLVVVHAGRESQRAVAARHGLEQPRADRRRTTVLRDEYHGLRAQVQRQRRAWSRLATRRDDVSAPVARRDAFARDVEAGERNLLVTLDREDLGEDRKSTRLNSSHVKISYAVFCLKKKNKTYNTTRE